MPKTLEQLPEDIYNVLSKEEPHEVGEENIQSFLRDMESILRNRLTDKNRDRTALRFSALGMPDRKMWYQHNTPEDGEKFTGQTLLKFLFGDLTEAMVLFLAKEAGHTVEREQEEIEVNGVFGHIDCLIDGVLIDVKSASPYGFKKFENNSLTEDDPFGYVAQLSGYANVLTPNESAGWVAFDKVSAKIATPRLSSSIIKDHEPLARINHLNEILKLTSPPPRCYDDVADGKSGNRKLAIACSYCAFKDKCWPELRTFYYSTGPRFLTKVVRTPDVPEAKR